MRLGGLARAAGPPAADCEGFVRAANTRSGDDVQWVSDHAETEDVLMAGDDIVKIEQREIERLIALGYGRYDAIRLVDAGIAVSASVLALPESATPPALKAAWRIAPSGLPLRLQAG